jgi:hypothetical protein
MPATPNNNLPYPVPTDTPDVPRDIKALADRLDLILTAPPAGGGAAALAQLPILDVGVTNQHRAGHQLTLQDFTGRGLSAPIGLWNLSDISDSSGNNRPLTNKASVPFGVGINGLATTAAVFAGATTQALYIADAGAGDPFRIGTGSFGAWSRSAKRDTQQSIISKWGGATVATWNWLLYIESTNVITIALGDSITVETISGTTDVTDDRWHFVVVTHDATVTRLYVDGTLEASGAIGSTINIGACPLNIGANGADGATSASSPHYGRVDEAFVTADILTEDQIRLLYASKFPHGYTLPPSTVTLNVRRRRKGATLAAADFPTQPIRLHNLTSGSLSDEGSGNVPLVSNPDTGTIVVAAGADGATGNAYDFSGAHAGLSSTDAGLPAGTTARSHGCWFKTSNATGNPILLGWGTIETGDARLYVGNGTIGSLSAADAIAGPFVADGQWHQVIAVEDNAAADGVRRKLYLDGRLVGGSTVLTAIVLAGANRFRVGANHDGTGPWVGQLDGAFVCGYALTFDQIASLYAKAGQALPPSPKNAGDHVEGIDATNLYAVFDTLDSTAQVDLYATA